MASKISKQIGTAIQLENKQWHHLRGIHRSLENRAQLPVQIRCSLHDKSSQIPEDYVVGSDILCQFQDLELSTSMLQQENENQWYCVNNVQKIVDNQGRTASVYEERNPINEFVERKMELRIVNAKLKTVKIFVWGFLTFACLWEGSIVLR